ncbi:MAG: cell division protein SepF [Acidimicrobiaceae bacterium]|nr:cell division protein SepF [Acidimicrobiaceae bacterium]
MASGVVRRAMVYLGLTDEEEFEYDAYEEPREPEPVGAAAPAAASQRRAYAETPEPSATTGSVSVRPISPRDPAPEPSGGVAVAPPPRPVVRPMPTPASAKVHVVAPSRFSDAQEIGDRFKKSQPVLVDLKRGDRELSRRMIDFCSGITYGLEGAMEKVGDQVFLLTPSNVEVSADEKRKLAEKGLYRT